VIDCSLLIFHQIFKACIVRSFILFIFKDVTYVFYPRAGKKSAYEKFPSLLTHSSAENEQGWGAPILSARDRDSLGLQGLFGLRGWKKCRRAPDPTDAVASCPSQTRSHHGASCRHSHACMHPPPIASRALLHASSAYHHRRCREMIYLHL